MLRGSRVPGTWGGNDAFPDGETVPGTVEGVACLIQALQIAAMGMACADSLQFEELVAVCEEERRRGGGSSW